MTMAPYLRLRQICLVAPRLEPVISDIAGIMGLSVCYRDGNVAKYGLENALLPVDTILLEVVAPTQPGTAAGRSCCGLTGPQRGTSSIPSIPPVPSARTFRHSCG